MKSEKFSVGDLVKECRARTKTCNLGLIVEVGKRGSPLSGGLVRILWFHVGTLFHGKENISLVSKSRSHIA